MNATDKEMLAQLRESAAWREIQHRNEARVDAQRTAAAEALVRVTRHEAQERPALEREHAAALKAVSEATAALEAAQHEARRAHYALEQLSTASMTATMFAEKTLRTTAPPELGALIAWLMDERDRSRHVISRHEIPGKPDLVTDKRRPRVITNAPSVKSRIAAINAALQAAVALQTAPLTLAAIRGEVATLRNSIPSSTVAFSELSQPV